MTRIVRGLKWLAIGAGLLLLVASIVPFLIPIEHSAAPMPERPFENSLHAEAGGVRVHAQAWPAASVDGPEQCAFALIHGFAGSTYSWRELAPRLAARGHAVIAVDLPGFGYSDRRNWSVDDGEGVWAVLDATRPGARWCLIGHSMGARVAAAVSSRQPGRIDAVVYLGGGPLRRAEPGLRQQVIAGLLRLPPVQRWVAVYADRTQFNVERFTTLLGSAYGRVPTAAEVEGYLAPLQVEGTAAAILSRMATARASVDEASITPLPTLLLWGAVDTWVPPQVAERTRERIPGFDLVMLAGAGHNPMETHVEQTWQALAAWLDAQATAAPPDAVIDDAKADPATPSPAPGPAESAAD
jgi:pimeloyl-ACP methyl ester carboxylesterase